MGIACVGGAKVGVDGKTGDGRGVRKEGRPAARCSVSPHKMIHGLFKVDIMWRCVQRAVRLGARGAQLMVGNFTGVTIFTIANF